jgi:hypothetical protein
VKIDDREVSAAVIAHWKQALGGMPYAALSIVAWSHTSIQAGFRPGKVYTDRPVRTSLHSTEMLPQHAHA